MHTIGVTNTKEWTITSAAQSHLHQQLQQKPHLFWIQMNPVHVNKSSEQIDLLRWNKLQLQTAKMAKVGEFLKNSSNLVKGANI